MKKNVPFSDESEIEIEKNRSVSAVKRPT